MDIEIREVKNKRDLKKFIHLPAKIHKNHTNWVPPIYMDDRVFFNPNKNRSFSHSDTILLLAAKSSKVVGRVMGIINHQYNSEAKQKEVRFAFIETFNDFEVASALIQKVEDWGKTKGMEKLVGPLGFSDKDPQGLLIEGFDKPVVIATNYNFEYMVDFVERYGLTKKVDLVVYKLEIPEEIPDFYLKIQERAFTNNPKLRLVKFRNRLQLKPYIKPVFRLVNETFKDIYSFTPLSEKEMDEFANRFLFILNPKFIKIIETDKKEVVAFVLSMPNMSDGVRKCRGRVIPFGLFQMLRAQKKTKQLDLLLGGIKEEYRNAGLDAVLGIEIFKEAKKAGFKYIDSHLELETNIKMRAENEKMGGVVYKRYRIFEKEL
jgi:hypothetical protein